MPGVTASDVERFFHASRAAQAKPPDARQQRLNDIFAKRARDEAEARQLDSAADRRAWERQWG